MDHITVELDEEPFSSGQEQSVIKDVQSGELSYEDQPPQQQQLSSSWLAVLTLDYYQSLFDVSTKQVALRTVAGMVPFYWTLVDTLGTNPDLYGPFWLAVTLIITTAVSGNVSNLFINGNNWEFHFAKVTQLASVVFVYIWVVPMVLWAVLWWRGNRQTYTLLQLLAIYGYSMGVFIPLSILWVIHSEVLRWLLLALGCTLSGGVLLRSLWKPLSADSRKVAVVMLALVMVLHTGLSVGFKFFYFLPVPGLSSQSNSNLTSQN